MLTLRRDGSRLLIRYRFRPLAIVAAGGVAGGIAVLALALLLGGAAAGAIDARLLGLGGLLVVSGLGLLAVFAIGSRVTVELGGDFWRHGSRRVRGKSADITDVTARAGAVVATMRDGRELALIATVAGTQDELAEVAARIREHLRS